MLTTMRNVPLRRLVIALTWVLVIFAAFATGTGMYAAALALWPLVLVWWPWLLAGVIAVVVLGAWWLWWRLPKRQVNRLRLTIRDAKARADVEDNFRKTIGQLLGGAALLIGAGFAYLQFQQQQQSSRDVLISNQVGKGFELLGNKEKQLEQRLGGIYALEGVMNTSEQYYRPVLEALCAFVREETKASTGDGPPAADIQAALTVIGRRKAIGEGKPDLTYAYIPGANLVRANLDGANLSPANLFGAKLSSAFLNSAYLGGANLATADLSRAKLSSAFLNSANLTRADLGGANLGDASLADASLIGAILTYADLDGADLGGAFLSYAHLDGATLTRADLGGANLNGANLSRADLRRTEHVSQAQLDQACGTDARLDPGLTLQPCPTSPPAK
jgi:uncharacterized protein YjbI with pentapeptide repeats